MQAGGHVGGGGAGRSGRSTVGGDDERNTKESGRGQQHALCSLARQAPAD